MTANLQPHPLADIFPKLKDIDPDGFKAFVEDIKDRGQQSAIAIYEGKVLDGRNRYDACIEAGIEPKVQPYTGDDPIGFVLSANLHRRHLNESQRAMVAAKLATLEVGANQHRAKAEGTSIDAASKALNVGRASIDRAKVVLKSGDQGLIKEVEKGEVSVSAAAAQVKQNTASTDGNWPAGGGKGRGRRKGKGGSATAAAAPTSIDASEAYDEAEEALLACLKELAADAAEAAASETIGKMQDIVWTMLGAAQKEQERIEAANKAIAEAA